MPIRNYGTLTFDALAATETRAAELSSDIYLDIGVGDTVVRFLPSLTEGGNPLRSTALHYVTLPGDKEKRHVFSCPKQELSIPCLVCARAAELQRSSIPAERNMGWDFAAKLRIFANVLPRAAPRGGAKVLGFGKMLFDALKAIRKSQHSGGDMFNPYERGFDVVINRTGTGMTDTRYAASAVREFSALAPTHEEIDEVMGTCHDLEQQVKTEIPEIVLAHFAPPRGFAAVPSPRPQQAIATSARPAATGAAFARHPTPMPLTAATATDFDDDFNPIV